MSLLSEPLFIDIKALDEASAGARNSPRRRRNLNFHTHDQATVHRMLNAVEPGSYIAPHRHLDPEKGESLIVLRGVFGMVWFDDNGAVVSTAILSSSGPIYGVNIPPGVYHTLVSLEPDSVFFETKAGPYKLLTPDERAPWAPEENSSHSLAYMQQLRLMFVEEPLP